MGHEAWGKEHRAQGTGQGARNKKQETSNDKL